MIDLEYAEKAFNEYLKDYNLNNSKIALKAKHMVRVKNLSNLFATELKWSIEDVELATLIGLLHDLGRFEQVRVYNTFSDLESIDHADYSCKQLFPKHQIRKFIHDSQYDNIIYKAIKNHNKLKIEDGLDERTLLHCKIIRDSDKTDIYEAILSSEISEISGQYSPEDQINIIVWNNFLKGEPISKSDALNIFDNLILKISFIFDYNFKIGLKYIKEKNYINRLIDEFYNNYKISNESTRI